MRIDPAPAEESELEEKDSEGLSKLDLIRMKAAIAFSLIALVYFFIYVLFL